MNDGNFFLLFINYVLQIEMWFSCKCSYEGSHFVTCVLKEQIVFEELLHRT